ncbi:hypothetical protein BKA67DRAFT_586531 [Truncatella angustata]|uniref:Uncharacterized protein n=1 Tax=Truncatella angustata TaxID=152316 RepID=A0A9P8UB39_9PEZI|nr:uncharacterized protein BKA67DRAFT_586531 [Truncatella angustata]KAH6644946.1 hypothetical protein BKA67DRAFT_586531 [Truncatella angustata]
MEELRRLVNGLDARPRATPPHLGPRPFASPFLHQPNSPQNCCLKLCPSRIAHPAQPTTSISVILIFAITTSNKMAREGTRSATGHSKPRLFETVDTAPAIKRTTKPKPTTTKDTTAAKVKGAKPVGVTKAPATKKEGVGAKVRELVPLQCPGCPLVIYRDRLYVHII